MYCNQVENAEARFAKFFKATDGRLKSFCTVLKTRIRLKGSRLESSKVQGSRARKLEGSRLNAQGARAQGSKDEKGI